MIPKIIHYVWMGGASLPPLEEKCIASWKEHMPDWEYMRWDETNFDIAAAPLYVRQAYEARKFAFVSDYVRLWALEKFGGVYLDTDVEVLKSYEPLLGDTAFMGFEESKAHLLGTCTIGCEAHCLWVKDMLATYEGARFIKSDGSLDMTTNVERLGKRMVQGELIADGQPQYLEQWGLRIYDFHHFCPLTSTRVLRKNKNTYSIHHLEASWTHGRAQGWRSWWIVREITNALVQVKRKLYCRF